MSKVVREIVGISLIVVGALFAPALILQGVMILAGALLEKGPAPRQASNTTLQLGETSRKAAFGRVATAGSLNEGFDHDGKYNTDWEVLDITLADHRCKGLVGVYVNDVYVAFAPTGDDIADQNGTVPGYNDQLRINFYPGTETQIVKQTLIDFDGYAASDNLAGVCHVVVHYKADDEKAKNPVFPGGRPRFLFVLDGAFCYDPRKDSTVAGGSGPHRWDDPSTWEWSDNTIICRYNWARGIYACDRIDQPDMLLVGRGLTAIEAPPENVAWRANICDEAVPLAAGGSEPRYRCGVIVEADEQFDATEQMWVATVAGVLRQPEGSLEVDPGHAVTPTFAITDDDLLIGAKLSFSRFRNQADTAWCNTVIPNYVEPAQKWVQHSAPLRRVYADVIADGGARENTLPLDAVTSGTQAQRCGEIARRMGRLLRTATVVVGPRFAGVEEGDWGTFTSARHTGGEPVTFRVEAMALDEKWQNTLTLREMSADVFAWTTADEIAEGAVATANPVPTYGAAPDIGDWALIGGNVTGSNGALVPALILTGAVTDVYASAIIVEYRTVEVDMLETGKPALTVGGGFILSEAAPGDWQAWGTLDPATKSITISPVAANGVYEVAVSYVVRGTVTDQLIMGPVGAGDMAVASGAHTLRSIAPSFPITADDTHIMIADATAQIDDGTTIVLPAATLGGLTSGISYGVFFNIVTQAWLATPYPSETEMGLRDNIFLSWMTTTVAGVVPPPDVPPPTYGGTDANCVTVDTPILMADGDTRMAGELVIGDLLRTRHETTLAWGDYPITAISFAREPVLGAEIAGTHIRATRDHRFRLDGAWVRMGDMGQPWGTELVARITVAGAHTYVSAGILSHNIKAI